MKNKILTTIFLIILGATHFLAACSPIIAGSPELQTVTLKLNWKHGTTFIGFYIAQSQGFYAAEGLDVNIEELSDPSLAVDIPSEVLNGEYDFGIAGSDLARAQAKGLELTAIGNIIKLGPAAFFARKDLGINTPADFAGHSIVVKSLSWQELLEEFLGNVELTLDDVVVYSGGYDMTPFFEGEVDVWAGFITEEVVQARLRGIEITTFPLYEYGRTGSSVTMFTSEQMLATNRDLAVRFVRASIKGWQFAIDNPTQSVMEMLAQYPGLTDGFDYYLASFAAAIPLIIPSGAQLGAIDCTEWAKHKQFSGLSSLDGLCTTDIYFASLTE